jgi:hypothetical protein
MSAEPGFEPEAILRVLNDHNVDYVVVGGFAVAAHGVIRATADLDVVVEKSWQNAGRLATALERLDAHDATGAHTPLTQEVLARRADRKLQTRYGTLHILHEVPGAPDYRSLQPPERVSIEGLVVSVATLEVLRRMKRAAGRPKDELDLAELEALHGPEEA